MSKGYPGTGKRPLICDICGFKLRLEDVTMVTDRYNPQNRLIVCKKDRDKLNPQFIPHKIPKDTFLSDPSMVRPEPEPITYSDNPNSDRLPSAPRFLQIILDTLSNRLYLYWQGPIDNGSSPILGYRIFRTEPQFATEDLLISSTNTSATNYLDLTSDPESVYSYRVAAISELGLGPYSDYAYWPYKTDSSINYLVTSNTLSVIKTGSGDYFIL